MKFKFLNLFLLIIALTLNGFSQTVEIYQNDDYSVCPDTEIQYSAVHSSTSVNCGHNWEITNGTIISYESQDSLWVFVKWDDSNTDGILEVLLHDCDDNTFNAKTNKQFYKIFSLKGVQPSTITGKSSVAYGTQTETYSINDIEYPNVASEDDPYVNIYKWQIPTGWICNGVVSTGSNEFTTSESEITVTADETSSGTIQVWGVSQCENASESAKSSLPITRSFPSFDINLSTNNDYLQGNKTPFTFSVPNWSYATYSWTLPSGWEFQASSTTSTIVVIPDECTGGEISCTVTIPA